MSDTPAQTASSNTDQPVDPSPSSPQPPSSSPPSSSDDDALSLGSLADSFTPSSSPPHRLIRAEAVLAHRTSRIVLVLEQMVDNLNHQAALRTAEALGIQHVYTVVAQPKFYTLKGGVRFTPTVTTGSSKWLTIHSFPTTEDCIAALKADSREIWCTYLGPNAHPLTPSSTPPLPPRLAIVMGRELDGVSPFMLQAASRLVYLPQYGFTESFNVSVATALVLQRLLDLCEDARGDMGEEERRGLRRRWYRELAPRGQRADEYEQWVEKGDRGEVEWEEGDLRPREEVRVPRINKAQRKRVIQAGQREVVIGKGGTTVQPDSHQKEDNAHSKSSEEQPA